MNDTCRQFDALIARSAQLTTKEAAAPEVHLDSCTMAIPVRPAQDLVDDPGGDRLVSSRRSEPDGSRRRCDIETGLKRHDAGRAPLSLARSGSRPGLAVELRPHFASDASSEWNIRSNDSMMLKFRSAFGRRAPELSHLPSAMYTAAMGESHLHFHAHMVPRYAVMPRDAKAWSVFDLQRAVGAGEVAIDRAEVERISEAYRQALQDSPPP